MLCSQLEICKAAGNVLFSARKYGAAREKYTEGISLLPSGCSPAERGAATLASTLFSNRALCAKFSGDWEGAESDARSAINLDRMNAKSHYVLGLALRASGLFADATARLERASDMARRQKRGAAMEAQFEGAAAAARAAWHAASEAANDRADDNLEAICVESLADAENSSGSLLRVQLPLIFEGDCPPYSAAALPAVSDDGAAINIYTNVTSLPRPKTIPHDARAMDQLNALFAGRRKERALRIVPTWAQDPVTFDVMLDPVMGPTAISYERSTIVACLKVKQECPVTRSPLVVSSLVPNRSLKAAITWWLAEHPWAHPAAEAQD